MREGWEVKKLKEVCDKITDGTHQTPKYFDEGIIFLSSKNVTSGKIDWENIKYIDEAQHIQMHKRVAPKVGDILLAKNGTTGVAAMVDRDVVFDIYVSLAHIRSLGEIMPEYMLYFINSPIAKSQFNKRLKGIGVPNLHLKEIREVEITYPKSQEEQKQIVALLDKAFTAIDQTKANIEKNIENAKELFENWTFQTIKNANWNNLNWGEVCDFTRGPFGGSLKKSMFVEAGYAVYEQKQAIHNDYDALRYFVDEEKFQEMKRFEVKSGDLLMSCSGVTLGRISEVPEDAPQGIINQALLKLRAKPNKILNEFLVIWIRSKIFQDLIFKFAGGAAQPNVPGVKILKAIKVPCPTINEQLEFINLHNDINKFTDNSINANLRKIESLEELKKSILQKAFAGELTQKAVAI